VQGNAYYDAVCDLIAYDRTLLEELATEHGRFLPPVIMAHEFGHAMQGRFGFAASGRSIQDETQADCLAGAWSAWVAEGEARHVTLRAPELDDVVDGFLLLRDQVGIDGGVGPCRDNFGPDRLFTAAPFEATDLDQGDAPYADIVDWVGALLPSFWETVFPEAFGERFRRPALQSFDGAAPACGSLEPAGDLAFCPDDATVYYDESDLTGPVYDEQGDFAVATALSLPYALAAREQAGLSTDDGAATRSAVCLTGWFAAEWYDGALRDTLQVTLSPGDLDEAVMFLLTHGVDERVFPDVAASGFELVGAFRAGFLHGGAACDIGL
jgi:predicted metalloprotease